MKMENISRLFFLGRKFRLILNLKHLNKDLTSIHFNMETIPNVLTLITSAVT